MDKQKDVTGIILAGGMSRRLGRDKAVEKVGRQTLIERVMGRLSLLTSDIVVVVNDSHRVDQLPVPNSARIVVDQHPGTGSLGGIFTGLASAREEWGLVVACDMPFLKLELLSHILSLRQGYDAVVPMLEERPEPTHAAYSKKCLPHIKQRLQVRDLKIARFFGDIRIKYVFQEKVTQIDPNHLSFMNVNTQEDLDYARNLVKQGF